MFKYLVVALAALFAILQVFGAPERRVEVTRPAANSDGSGLSLASFVELEPSVEEIDVFRPSISESEAIQLALAAGIEARANEGLAPLRGAAVAAATSLPSDDPAAEESANFWYVTGTTVNLRQGPGTGNAVVGQVTHGAEAEILDDRDGWYQIRTADGVTSGWIFGKFLAEQAPG